MKVLLTGSAGQLGQALIASAPQGLELMATSRSGGQGMAAIDLSDADACRAAVEEYRKKRGIKSRLMSIREDPSLNTRLFGFSQKDQRSDVFEAVA